jgi:hypothetical protein
MKCRGWTSGKQQEKQRAPAVGGLPSLGVSIIRNRWFVYDRPLVGSGTSLLVLSGKTGASYSRMLSLIDSASGASMSIEMGLMTLVHKGGNTDTIRFSVDPPDSLLLDPAGLMNSGRSSIITLGATTDTLQIVAAIYGRNPGTILGDGRVGFEILIAGTDSVIARSGVESGWSVANGIRRLTVLSVPLSSLPGAGPDLSLAVRPFVSGLSQQDRLTASLAHIYSNVRETPSDHILSGLGGNASQPTAPQAFVLAQNFPNPCNPTTSIWYSVPQQASVRIEIYSVLGQLVKTLVDNQLQPGVYTTLRDSRSNSGQYPSTGCTFTGWLSMAMLPRQRKCCF